jgi:hypothetical protein
MKGSHHHARAHVHALHQLLLDAPECPYLCTLVCKPCLPAQSCACASLCSPPAPSGCPPSPLPANKPSQWHQKIEQIRRVCFLCTPLFCTPLLAPHVIRAHPRRRYRNGGNPTIMRVRMSMLSTSSSWMRSVACRSLSRVVASRASSILARSERARLELSAKPLGGGGGGGKRACGCGCGWRGRRVGGQGCVVAPRASSILVRAAMSSLPGLWNNEGGGMGDGEHVHG